MANLSAGALSDVFYQAMSDFSGIRREVPINKPQFKAFMTIVDEELEATEIAIAQAIPAGPGKTWIMANPEVARALIVMVEEKRQEEL